MTPGIEGNRTALRSPLLMLRDLAENPINAL
jgi:hypothetical protein